LVWATPPTAVDGGFLGKVALQSFESKGGSHGYAFQRLHIHQSPVVDG
jgi:hypothetical protein